MGAGELLTPRISSWRRGCVKHDDAWSVCVWTLNPRNARGSRVAGNEHPVGPHGGVLLALLPEAA